MIEKHTPVLLSEAVEALNIKPNSWYVDATFGRGGHTSSILSRGGRVIAFDWDPEAIVFGKKQFEQEIQENKLILTQDSFANLNTHLDRLMRSDQAQVDEISGILFDFGTSTEQLTSSERGFSFAGEGPLDMRMDPSLGVTAADLLAVVPEKQLAELFRDIGGELFAKPIARAIKKSPTPIKTTKQLRELIEKVAGGRKSKIHPATKVFQALRIAVNSELDQIRIALPQALSLVSAGGVIATIAFHEGEDRIAKHFFKKWQSEDLGILEDTIKPTAEEIENNPRSRSARLRVFKKN